MSAFSFQDVARLPLPGDNTAIATQRLEKGARVQTASGLLTLDATILEGHRFAVAGIAQGQAPLSWRLPFGTAVRDIAPGEYLCNADMLQALRGRSIPMDLPTRPNFKSAIPPFQLTAANFEPGPPTTRTDQPGVFRGYARAGGRGTGTRNYIVLLGTSSLTGGFVRALETRLQADAQALPNVDGIVAVAHTEGAVPDPNNRELALRTLAGYVVHPNVGGILAVDYGSEAINNARLQAYLRAHGYPWQHVIHAFYSLDAAFEHALARAADTVRAWYGAVNGARREERPLADLKLALQCGGSDAFSGISGNPLAAWAAKEVIRHGGAANLAETDELIGAEPYVLQNVKDWATACRFLEVMARFKERAAWHGHTAEGNPSGGNKLRGLYNIFLKSIGAAMKRHPDVRLDHVLEYGTRMTAPGYYFMDSPGNDLESIAGQVAAGCNLIFFVTGNGSITNFPFAPTVKIVTTTERYELLRHDMDVNAGQYLDGASMDALGRALFARTVQVASGQRTLGERAGHAQIQLWRNWPLNSGQETLRAPLAPLPEKALAVAAPAAVPTFRYAGEARPQGVIPRAIGLIVPTSLCSGQIAVLAVRRLNKTRAAAVKTGLFFATLVHTEGCGVSSGSSEELYARTLAGYVQHAHVQHCLLLEHGCEKTHNDFMKQALQEAAVGIDDLGWASVQLDGGIAAVLDKIDGWFGRRLAAAAAPRSQQAGLGALRLGVASHGALTAAEIALMARCARVAASQGGQAVALAGSAIARALTREDRPTLAYAQKARQPGLHLMECPTQHWVETLSGLGATGVDLVIACGDGPPLQGHPFIPLLQVSLSAEARPRSHACDLVLDPAAAENVNAQRLYDRMGDVLSGRIRTRSMQVGNVDFQITRGPAGISL